MKSLLITPIDFGVVLHDYCAWPQESGKSKLMDCACNITEFIIKQSFKRHCKGVLLSREHGCENVASREHVREKTKI